MNFKNLLDNQLRSLEREDNNTRKVLVETEKDLFRIDGAKKVVAGLLKAVTKHTDEGGIAQPLSSNEDDPKILNRQRLADEAWEMAEKVGSDNGHM